MADISIDGALPVDIEIQAETVAVFRYTAQYRVPGGDYIDFATAKDSSLVSRSAYRLRLNPPVASYTDLRIYFLIDGPAERPYRIDVTLSQNGQAVGQPIVCSGQIGGDGKMVFDTAEATLV